MSADDDPEKSRRVVGRPFPKGVSGNPGGKPKTEGPTFLPPTTSTPEEVDKRIVVVAAKALALLEAVIEDASCETRDRVVAARAVLDKVKPNASPPPPPDPDKKKHEEELEDFVATMKAKGPRSDGDVSS